MFSEIGFNHEVCLLTLAGAYLLHALGDTGEELIKEARGKLSHFLRQACFLVARVTVWTIAVLYLLEALVDTAH